MALPLKENRFLFSKTITDSYLTSLDFKPQFAVYHLYCRFFMTCSSVPRLNSLLFLSHLLAIFKLSTKYCIIFGRHVIQFWEIRYDVITENNMLYDFFGHLEILERLISSSFYLPYNQANRAFNQTPAIFQEFFGKHLLR